MSHQQSPFRRSAVIAALVASVWWVFAPAAAWASCCCRGPDTAEASEPLPSCCQPVSLGRSQPAEDSAQPAGSCASTGSPTTTRSCPADVEPASLGCENSREHGDCRGNEPCDCRGKRPLDPPPVRPGSNERPAILVSLAPFPIEIPAWDLEDAVPVADQIGRFMGTDTQLNCAKLCRWLK